MCHILDVLYDWNENVVTSTKFSSLVAPEVVAPEVLTTSDAVRKIESIRHRNKNVILTKFSSRAVLKVVNITISGAANDENLVKIIFPSRVSLMFSTSQSGHQPSALVLSCSPSEHSRTFVVFIPIINVFIVVSY